eukprot:scaffold53106_cov15-Prasinocladus_malaysianus.AAC.1
MAVDSLMLSLSGILRCVGIQFRPENNSTRHEATLTSKPDSTGGDISFDQRDTSIESCLNVRKYTLHRLPVALCYENVLAEIQILAVAAAWDSSIERTD